MCEACGDTGIEWEETSRLPPDEEWFCDDERCHARATWRTRFSIVDEHLCDSHKPAEPDEGLDTVLDGLDLGEASYYLAIKASEECEGELLGPPCTRPARWAQVSIMSSFACDRHKPKPVGSGGASARLARGQ